MLSLLSAAVQGDPPETRLARVALMEERHALGLDLWSGAPATLATPRPVAELVAQELPRDEDLRDRAVWLDREEERTRALARARGVDEDELEDAEERTALAGDVGAGPAWLHALTAAIDAGGAA